MSTAVDKTLFATKEDILMISNQMQNLFDKLDNKMDKRFNELEAKYDQRFNAINDRFTAIDHRFNKIEKQIDALDIKYWALGAGVAFLLAICTKIMFGI